MSHCATRPLGLVSVTGPMYVCVALAHMFGNMRHMVGASTCKVPVAVTVVPSADNVGSTYFVQPLLDGGKTGTEHVFDALCASESQTVIFAW
jgi:hypothetical protein